MMAAVPSTVSRYQPPIIGSAGFELERGPGQGAERIRSSAPSPWPQEDLIDYEPSMPSQPGQTGPPAQLTDKHRKAIEVGSVHSPAVSSRKANE
jgi:hypothetical protein